MKALVRIQSCSVRQLRLWINGMKKSVIIEAINAKPPVQRTPEEMTIIDDFIKQNLWVLKSREERDNKKLDVKKSKFVVDDENETQWRFFEGAYYRVKGNGISKGVKVGRLRGEYLPDPMKRWEEKCKVAGVRMGTPEAANYRPSPAVFSLWEDWQKRGA